MWRTKYLHIMIKAITKQIKSTEEKVAEGAKWIVKSMAGYECDTHHDVWHVLIVSDTKNPIKTYKIQHEAVVDGRAYPTGLKKHMEFATNRILRVDSSPYHEFKIGRDHVLWTIMPDLYKSAWNKLVHNKPVSNSIRKKHVHNKPVFKSIRNSKASEIWNVHNKQVFKSIRKKHVHNK